MKKVEASEVSLIYHDEFIAQGRKNVLDRLRHDNEPHSAPFAKAEAKRRFPLTGIDRLNAGTNNLRDIGGAIADEGDSDAQELLLIEGGYQHGQSKVEEIQLQQHGGTASPRCRWWKASAAALLWTFS